ncbi:MAG: sulfotransferase domain-containing protein [Pseudomonadota bacterium]|nr:sulfotransferase domain-containing protein [Pseudomonadota bacterium]
MQINHQHGTINLNNSERDNITVDLITAEIVDKWGAPSPMHDPYVLANFQPRESDVLITTAPKAGTTWMQQILYQLRSGGDESFTSIDDVVPWLERKRAGKTLREVLEYYERITDPRAFKTHCTAEQTPGIGTASIILTSRDPRECCVSFYHHLRNMTDEARQAANVTVAETFEEHVDRWLGFAAWYRNVKSWWPYHDHEKVLWLRFQDMKADLPSNIDKIIDFLGWDVSAEQREQALEFSSFKWMKAHDEKFSSQGDGDKSVFKPGKFIREGKVGKHSELMTPEQEQRILDKVREMLEPECLLFLELDKN